MSYYFKKQVNASFEDAVVNVTDALKTEGFGVLTTINVQETLKVKLGVAFPKYTILGACNPTFAHKALSAEKWIGLMLPCNVVVQENSDGTVEVGAIKPMESMQAVENSSLGAIASEVESKLMRVIASLN